MKEEEKWFQKVARKGHLGPVIEAPRFLQFPPRGQATPELFKELTFVRTSPSAYLHHATLDLVRISTFVSMQRSRVLST
jgi:hypothetical protein